MKIGRLLLAAVLAFALAASACSGAVPASKENGSAAASSGPVVAPAGTGGAQAKQSGGTGVSPEAIPAADKQDTVAGICPPMPDSNAYGYVEELSRLWGEYRIPRASGQARDVFAREAEALAAGWPTFGTDRWATEAWSEFEVQRPKEGILYLVLRHTDGLEENVTRFFLVCEKDGNWRFAKVGTEQDWFIVSPLKLEGQDGTLTEELAKDIVIFAAGRYGLFAMRTAATGRELERGHMLAIGEAAGAPVEYPKLNAAGRLKLETRSANEVVGTWMTDQGAPKGQQVLFKREGGLWKLADHTVDGKWAPDKPTGYTGPPAFKFDRHLMGINLGMTQKEVRAIVMEEPDIEGNVHTYPLRKFTVEYDSQGRVKRIDTKYGATARGVHTGFPESSIVALYGQPTTKSGGLLTYSDGLRVLRLEMDTYDGKEQLTRITLEYKR
ncbi:MAG TPA: hypothetical protein VNT75_06775 [Symbiobacteriaceae bacterium]|nr:hypothetical protein [Symbiobacteriaceae bacterium]